MRHGSLFSGIGGFDLAAEWMGWENVFHCEWNPFGQKILKHYWPNAISYTDITKTDFTIHGGGVDVLSGGFPCQPFSNSGKQKGEADDRYLWPEMLRAVREIQPAWVIGENVTGILNMGFEYMLTELELLGYRIEVYQIPACAINKPHRRDRVWIIANSNSFRCENQAGRSNDFRFFNGCTAQAIREEYFIESPLCGVDDGLPDWVDRNKALGNAIVPQVAYEIFKAIEVTNHNNK